ncbi:MAG: hypothetical protein N5P05_003319 [Chroococcopsis gigantea SAG 12.99]|jgi:type IV secretory pathway VirB2 component (pilin)|nr:hypothetical protein [Chlorogloea purpurea SAG 13.99]MDV3001713.1 hypothetical protein [Chroococcopsis gigantea SAG 12.99]
MVALKFAVIVAIVLVIVKFVASIFGRGDIPVLNQLVTVILTLFVGFEVYQLGQTLVSGLR